MTEKLYTQEEVNYEIQKALWKYYQEIKEEGEAMARVPDYKAEYKRLKAELGGINGNE